MRATIMLTITERHYSTHMSIRVTRGDKVIAVHTSSDKAYINKMIARYAQCTGGVKHKYAAVHY